MKDDKKLQDPIQKAVPSDLSDHDERDEGMAVEKHWDQESDDPAAIAARRLKDFQESGTIIYDDDIDKLNDAEKMPEHLDAALDESLEELVDKKLGSEE